MKNEEALVAIIGEPNVGKSTILNKIVSERIALVSKIAGTTRDRFYAPTSWNGVDFLLVDTAGIIVEQRDELEKNVQKQVEIAIKEADLILYVIDGKKDPEHINRAVLNRLRKEKKNLVVAINKVDSPKKLDEKSAEYSFLGFKDIFACSATSGVGIGDMLDRISELLKAKGFGTVEKDLSEIAVSIVGKPNVGKSSLFNRILGEERVVVSAVAGTTRNTIDTNILYADKKIKILDTAGLKKKEKRAAVPDIYAALQTLRAVRKSDVCVLVIDSSEGLTKQDQSIAGDIVDSAKGLIIAVNKIDLLSPEKREILENNLADMFPFLWWTPVVPISAKTKEGIDDILNYIIKINENRNKFINNQTMSEFFSKKAQQRTPQRIRDERVPKVYSLHQAETNPPVFIMVVNEPSAISMQFRKFVQNSIIKDLDFWGTPVILKLQAKSGNPNSAAIND